MRARVFLLLMVLAGLAATLTLQRGWLFSYWGVPRYFDPFAALQLEDPPHLWTSMKFRRLSTQPTACLAFLEATDWRFTPVPAHQAAPGCALPATVRLSGMAKKAERSAIRLSSPLLVSCPVAASLALFERHTLRPLTKTLLNTEVTGVDHLGSFSCRNIGNAATGRRSEHALANAIDVAALRLADGRTLRLVRDWNAHNEASAYWRALRDGACVWFQGVLGPDYNAAHQDHFHLDRGPFRICR